MRFLTVLFLIAGLAAAGEPQREPRLQEMFGRLPLYFVENRGQVASEVSYYLQGRNSVYFTSRGMTLALTSENGKRCAVAVDIVGARRGLKPAAEDRTEAVVSYFKGPRPDWKTGISTYGTVLYQEAWPGIDLSWSGTAGRLEDTLVVRPGADPKRIRIRYRGATSVKLDQTGGLVVETPAGGFRVDRPLAYQEVDGKREEVPVRFALAKKGGNPVYGFKLGKYDRSRPLVIDPVVLVYCGYIEGASDDMLHGIAVDAAGNAYVVGESRSSEASFPVTVGPDLTYNAAGLATDAFVAKVKADGTGLAYAGYIGGASNDYGYGIAVDNAGAAYVTGYTYSNEASFPVVGGPDLTYNGRTDAFVAKVKPDGTGLVYCGYIGGDGFEHGQGIAVDGAGIAYVTGYAGSDETTFPVAVGPDLTYNGDVNDAFVAKVAADGTVLLYAGYIGGDGDDRGHAIAVDAAGNAYVAGETGSDQRTFPVTAGPDLTHNGGMRDVFVTKIKADGTALVYAGYIGGDADDLGYGIAVDAAGNAYVTGETGSDQTTFPVTVGPDLTFNSIMLAYRDAFVAKVKTDGTGLVYAGYIGGGNDDKGHAIAVDGAGNAYIAGETWSTEATFPVTADPDPTYNGGIHDAFVVAVNAVGTALLYAGYIGGASTDLGYAIAVDRAGNAYVGGWTASDQSTFPVLVGPDVTLNDTFNWSTFVAKLSSPVPCSAAAPIEQVKAVKQPADPDSIDFNWLADPAANGYNIWYVTAKEEIDQARQSSSPPAVPVTGCSVPAPATATACTDQGAVSRDAPTSFFYQVRTYCDASNEGP
jgi:hypothetical protein